MKAKQRDKDLFLNKFPNCRIIIETTGTTNYQGTEYNGSIIASFEEIAFVCEKKNFIYVIPWSDINSVSSKKTFMTNNIYLTYDDSSKNLTFKFTNVESVTAIEVLSQAVNEHKMMLKAHDDLLYSKEKEIVFLEKDPNRIKSELDYTNNELKKGSVSEIKPNEIQKTPIQKEKTTQETELNVYDVLILHLNNKRVVGKELTNHYLLIEKQIDTMLHIENLLKNGLLSIKSDFNHSLGYLKVPELKSILKDNGLKVGGNKPELMKRIKENIKEEDVSLPKIYIATHAGEKIIENTNYVLHFFYQPYIINLSVAHKLVKNQYNIDDKIEFIYLKLIENKKQDSHGLKSVVQRLTHYYKTIKKDKSVIRKFTNYAIYLEFIQGLKHFEFNIKYRSIKGSLLEVFYIDTESLEYYEDLILVEDINLNVLKKLFFADVSSFVYADKNICDDFCDILFCHVNRDTNISINQLPAIRNY
ncbi:TPA: SAP domain-containing protein, partial [Staphylococcus delphini]|nr:SAP domain-containing protein [Staphylococcus delphini]